MEEHLLPDPNEQPKAEPSKTTFMDKLTEWYERFNLFSKIEDDDHWSIMLGKIVLRIIGIIILIALSPLILVGLFFALIAAL
ncbi:MAG: hypothetical protein AAGI23_06845 [Bacteroidota bacterium]